MRKELAKSYSPKDFEDKIYAYWMDNHCFHAEVDRTKNPYTIVIPPPNITGQLHMGHALDETLQDILIRYRRMQGYCTLWLPGTDHASIATEAKIVEAMRKEGITKDDIGRDGFLKRAWAWKEQYGGRIVEQLKKLGSSCDWERERFTMDEGCNRAVREVFVRYYEEGLIYRGERIINWCPHCHTSISNAEVEFEEQDGFFWHLRYPLSDGSGYLELATTRPETLLGDTAVAVNPKDERYKQYVGKTVVLPLVGREIPVVADSYVDMEFGTGVVKITPAHDPNDFEVGRRHDLPVINVMTDDAKIIADYPKYAGMDRYEARKAIVADLEAGGYLIQVEPHAHNVGTCYRCGTTVEPRVSLQWFVKMEELAKPAIDVVRSGKIKFVPERFDKNYFNWMEDIRDWCISRQLWWGHQIPAFYCDDCGELVVTKEDTAVCPKCGKPMRQDPDTLDTWFSSALWPFSTLGWPDHTEELDYFYPTSTLVTGYDIITFWVSRMIVAGMAHMKEIPFDTVLIHGLVRDSQGRKMSKSLGNGIDPLEVIDQYGADALRFMLATGNAPGNDMRYMDEKVKASRNFANKLWNASRFIMMNLPEDYELTGLPESLTIEDKWILTRFNDLCKAVTENLDKFELGIAVSKLYDFIWDVYCDWYIELTKARLYGEDADRKQTAIQVLVYVLDQVLRLLHPFMPFITEEIWQSLPHEGEALIVAAWPQYREDLAFGEEESHMESVMNAIRSIRNRRAEMNVRPSKKAALYVLTSKPQVFTEGEGFILRLAYADSMTLLDAEPENLNGMVTCATADAKLYIPMGQLVDVAKELERINKELDKARKNLASLEGKLSNESFVSRAPEAVVAAERAKAQKARDLIVSLEESLKAMQAL